MSDMMLPQRDSDEPSAGSAARRILVVDDDSDLRRIVRASLDGHPTLRVVAEAADGASTLDACARDRPDIVVLDLGLPDMTGHDLLTRLRTSVPDVHVVIFTGSSQPSRRVAIEWGAADLVRKDERVPALVRSLENAALGALTATCELECSTSSAGSGRRFVQSMLQRWNRPELVDDAKLVVSELVTNAVLHARTSCTLSLRLSDGVLRIEVTDAGAGTPELQSPDAARVGGRGLRIVSALSSAWGIDPARAAGNGTRGKTVWAELTHAGD